MGATSYVFSGDRIALIVRGKKSPNDSPGLLKQHADCVLSNGMPIGFYGVGNTGSSGNASSGSGGSSKSTASGSNRYGFAMTGQVCDFSCLQRSHAPYVDAAMARAYKMVSTVLIIAVTPKEASAFDNAWADLAESPGTFEIVGWNCSTHASQMFCKAGILSGGIPGLDTPDHLYRQLCHERAGGTKSVSGYVGFSELGSQYLLTVEEP